MGFASPTFSAWRVAETDHFRIYSEGSEARLRSDAAMLEDYHKLLVLLTARTWPEDAPKLDIYLVDGLAGLRVIAPDSGQNVAGFYLATQGGIVAIAQAGRANDDWMPGRQILLHEYAHHFMMQVGTAAMPSWYVEGFAEYLMTATFRPDRVEFGNGNPGRYYTLLETPWIKMEQLLARPPKTDTGAFYAQSWLLTHYMFRTEGMTPKLEAYLARVNAGEDSITAFKAEVSDDLPAFQSQLRSYLDRRKITYSRMKRPPPKQADVVITVLSAAAEDMLLPFVSIQLPQKAETDQANLAKLRKAAAAYPADPWAMRTIAIAEAIGGEAPTAAALLDARLAEAPNDPLLLRWRATLYKADDRATAPSDVAAARKLLVRAFKADPKDWQVLYAYAQTFLNRPEPLPASVLDVLSAANLLAPQVGALGMEAGMALAQAGDYKLAYRVMAPFVFDPHGGADTLALRTLVSSLKDGDKVRVEAALDAMRFSALVPRLTPTE